MACSTALPEAGFETRIMAKRLLPRHVAFIPDSNRRWAARHGLSKQMGCNAGTSRDLPLTRGARAEASQKSRRAASPRTTRKGCWRKRDLRNLALLTRAELATAPRHSGDAAPRASGIVRLSICATGEFAHRLAAAEPATERADKLQRDIGGPVLVSARTQPQARCPRGSGGQPVTQEKGGHGFGRNKLAFR